MRVILHLASVASFDALSLAATLPVGGEGRWRGAGIPFAEGERERVLSKCAHLFVGREAG